MSVDLTEHEHVDIDVHAVRDRVALTVNQQVIWLDRREIDVLRHKLMMALRAMEFPPPATGVPSPRST